MLAVGSVLTVTAAVGGEDVPVHDLGGRWVVPGLFDSHTHLVSGGFRLQQLDLSQVTSKREFVTRVSEVAASRDAAAGEWVLGGGWDETKWGGEEPTAGWFDDVVDATGQKGRVLIWLLRADAHTGVASAAALRAAGVTHDAPREDPPGGVIQRRRDGAPTGVLRDNAMALVTANVPPPSEADRARAFRRAFDHYLSLGVTSVCDFGDIDHLAGSHVPGAAARLWQDLEILERMDAFGTLPIRVSAYLPLADWERVRDHPTRNGGWFRDIPAPRAGGETSSREEEGYDTTGYGDMSRVRVAGCKAFLDGSLGAGTALMREPYADDPTNVGIALCNLTTFRERAVGADAAGLQVAVHAIGDAAVDAALEAAEEAAAAAEARRASNDASIGRGGAAGSFGFGDSHVEWRRFRVEHAQHLTAPLEGQPRRMRAAGAVASVQPAHMALDRKLVVGKLGEARAARAYAFKTILDAGVALSGGSDWPIVDADPIKAMEAAVTRGRVDEACDTSDGPPFAESSASSSASSSADGVAWDPVQRLSAGEALAAYTTAAAHVARLNGVVGTLWRGALADFAVLDASPLDIGAVQEADEEGGCKRRKRRPRVVSTFVGGRCAFGCDGVRTASSVSAATTTATAAGRVREAQIGRVASAPGVFAALDQSGGSTPGALAAYGVTLDARDDPEDMFRRIHDMRSRIVTSDVFDSNRVVGAILFEDTVMNRRVRGVPTATYLWLNKGVVPFIKIDKGLEPEADGVQLMKPIPGLTQLLARCGGRGDGGEGGPGQYIFGTKARSVIHSANAKGIGAVVAQQFALAGEVIAAGLTPIVEPEVSIGAEGKAAIEAILLRELLDHLDRWHPSSPTGDPSVVLKLTLPEEPTAYDALVRHPKVARVVALSGGYSRDESCARLKASVGMSASFSRALTQGLRVEQTDEEFDAELDRALGEIFAASRS